MSWLVTESHLMKSLWRPCINCKKKNPLAKKFIVYFFFFFTFIVHNSHCNTVARCDRMGYFVCPNKRRTFQYQRTYLFICFTYLLEAREKSRNSGWISKSNKFSFSLVNGLRLIGSYRVLLLSRNYHTHRPGGQYIIDSLMCYTAAIESSARHTQYQHLSKPQSTHVKNCGKQAHVLM